MPSIGLAPVLAALDRYAREVVPTLSAHPLCGRPTLNVGTVQGGLSVNTVPDRATIEIDRRVLPGEDPQAAYRHVVDYLATIAGRARVDRARSTLHADDRTGRSRQRAAGRESADDRAGGRRPGRKDRRPLWHQCGRHQRGRNSLGRFWTGLDHQAHTADEWLALDQLELAAEVYYRFAARLRRELEIPRLEARGQKLD